MSKRPTSRRVLGAAVAIASVAAAASASCNAIVGNSEPTLRAGACGLPVAEGACQSCIAQRCCDEATRCAQSSGCSAYETCLFGCGGDYACRARCVGRAPPVAGIEVPSLDRCVVASCEAPCGVSCGVQGSYVEPDAAQACQDCIASNVCNAAESCGADLDCEELGHCAIACFTVDCEHACEVAHPESRSSFTSVLVSLGSTCLTACGGGGYWECVGRVTWPPPKANVLTVTLTIVDSASPSGVPDLRVKACSFADTDCTSPLATTTTDGGGRAVLPVAGVPNSYGFSGYFEVTGPGIPPYLYFLSFPLSEEEAVLDLLVATRSGLDSFTQQVTVPAQDGGTAPFALDPARGIVAVIAGDCYRRASSGVRFEALEGIDDRTLLRYASGTALSNTAERTDMNGLAFFLNAPTGAPIRVVSIPDAIGHASSTVRAFARPGALSLVQAYPTP